VDIDVKNPCNGKVSKNVMLKYSRNNIKMILLMSLSIAMTWNLSGKMVETCSCNMLCPCWFGVKELMIMDKGYCASAILFRIQNSSSDGVDLKGRDVVLAFDFPGPTLLDGNGIARLYIDDAADTSQRKQLEDIFQGRKGGPMQIVSSLLSKWLPTESTKIEVNDDGNNVTASVGSIGQIKSQQLKNQSGNPMILQGAGFASAFQMENDTFTLAPSATEMSVPDIPHPISTKSGAVAKFSWTGN
jgi:hypothetical protein